MRANTYIWLILIISIGLLFRIYLITYIPIKNALIEPIFITDLLGNGQSLNWLVTTLFGLTNIGVLFLVFYRILKKKYSLVIALLYSVSPWAAYLDISGSIYVFLLTWILLLFYGVQLLKEGGFKKGFLVTLISVVILFYTHFLMLLVILPILFVIFKNKIFDSFQVKIFIIILSILLVPLLILMINNKEGMINLTRLHVSLFTDPGLINSVRQFQGELGKGYLSLIGKIIENKYAFVSEHIINSVLKQFTPGTYFTYQAKLLGFSFSPPILLGFIIPFIVGLPKSLSYLKTIKISWLILFALLLPSILSKNSPDLNKLILIAPIIYFPIVLGITKLFDRIGGKINRVLLAIFLILIFFQSLVLLIDIPVLEKLRLVAIRY